MKTKLMVVAVMLLAVIAAPAAVPVAHAEDYTIAVALQGITDPHIVAGVSYNQETEKFAAVLTANIVGIKLGDWPCYISGVGVSLNTVAPGLEDAPIAAVSMPFLTCAPFGENVAIQVGMSKPIGGGLDVGSSYYAGVGISVGGGPTELSSKRVRRAQAKAAAKKRAEAESGPVPPVTLVKPAEDPHQEVGSFGR